jgi:short-subunit dehydrogenase
MATTNQIFVLITGATTPLGRCFARLFAEDGYCLFLVDTKPEVLETLQTEIKEQYPMITVTAIAKDLAVAGAAEELYAEVQQAGKKVSILVNYSDLVESGFFVDTDWPKELAMIHAHVINAARLTKLFLQEMATRNEGKILQIASVLSFVPAPRVAIYGAARKFALFFAEALQQEIRETDVTLTILFPADRDHQFFKGDHPETLSMLSDEDLARRGYDALLKGKKIEIAGETTDHHLRDFIPEGWITPDVTQGVAEPGKNERTQH